MLLTVGNVYFRNMIIHRHLNDNVFSNIFKNQLKLLILNKFNNLNYLKLIPKKIVFRKIEKKEDIINSYYYNFFLNDFYKSFNKIKILENNFLKENISKTNVFKKCCHQKNNSFILFNFNKLNLKKQNYNFLNYINNLKSNLKKIFFYSDIFIKKFLIKISILNQMSSGYEKILIKNFLLKKNDFFDFSKLLCFYKQFVKRIRSLYNFYDISYITNFLFDKNNQYNQNTSINSNSDLKLVSGLQHDNIFLNSFFLTEELKNKIIKQILILKLTKIHQVKLYLYSEKTGLLYIELHMGKYKNILNFISQDYKIRLALNSSINDLRKKMRKNGIILDKISVYDHSFFLAKDNNIDNMTNDYKNYQNNQFDKNKYSQNKINLSLKIYKSIILNDNLINIYV